MVKEDEDKDKVILWLAHDEIDDMTEYVEELKKDNIPSYSKIAVWGLAFTKSWYRRIERPQFAIYNTLLKCTKNLLCPDCFRKKLLEKTEKNKNLQKKKNGIAGIISNALEKTISIDKLAENKEEESEKDKDSESPKNAKLSEKTSAEEQEHHTQENKNKDESKNEDEDEDEDEDKDSDFLENEEIEALLNHLDCDFAKEEKNEKTKEERYYTIRIVRHALKKSHEYDMLVSHRRVHSQNVDKIFSLCIGAFSYFANYHIEKIFKVSFFLASNINGVFSTRKGQDITKKEFDKFLLFVQNTAALSKKKFMLLIDTISTLNQEILTKFVYDIIRGSITVTGIQKDLFDKYSNPSVFEISEFSKMHQCSLLSTFTPRIIILHQKENKTIDEMKNENAYLKENIETLLSDLKYSNASDFLAQLKKDLEEKNEQIKQLQNK